MLDMGCLPDVHRILSSLPATRQTLLFSVDMAADVAKAAASDEVTDALDYSAVAQTVRTVVTGGKFQLIETAAERVAERLRAIMDRAAAVLREHPVNLARLAAGKPAAVKRALARIGSGSSTVVHVDGVTGPYDFIAIVASARGVSALRRLLQRLPPNFPVPVVCLAESHATLAGHLAAESGLSSIAAGLESAALPGVKIVSSTLPPAGGSDTNSIAALQPNFQLLGDILQDSVDKKIETERLSSRYVAGKREVHNPKWLEVKHQIDSIDRAIAWYEKHFPARSAAVPIP